MKSETGCFSAKSHDNIGVWQKSLKNRRVVRFINKKLPILLCLFLLTLPSYSSAGPYSEEWPLSTAEIVFKAGWIGSYDVQVLAGDKIIAAYHDFSDQRGKFTIFNSDSTIFLAEQTFTNDRADSISIANLANGNFFIVYTVDNEARFIGYNPQGTIIKSETVFRGLYTGLVDTAVLTNGNIIIVYRDDSRGYKGKFMIFDSSGTLVTPETTYFHGFSGSLTVVALQNGSALIAYRNGPGQYGEFVIYSNSGTIIQAATAFDQGKISGLDASSLDNGNVIIAFGKGIYPYSGHFTIVDQTGAVVVPTTALNVTGSVDRVGSTILSDHDILLSYRHIGETYYSARIIILNSDGVQQREETMIYQGVVNNISPLTLATGDVLFPFWEGTPPYYGKYIHITDPTINTIPAIPGDVDNNGTVDLTDLIATLQIASSMDTGIAGDVSDADVNGDGYIGLAEAIYILGELSTDP